MEDLFADEENDKKCSYRKPDTFDRCNAFHVKNSPFCNVHGGGLEKMLANKQEKIQRQRELQEDLRDNLQKLESVEDIRVALSKIYNALMLDFIKKDKASALVFILQQLQKTFEKGAPSGGRGFLNIQINSGAEPAKIMAAFGSTQELDNFLLAGESASVTLLEDLQRQGRVTVEPKAEVIDVTPEPPVIDLFDLPTPHDWKKITDIQGDLAIISYQCDQCGIKVAKKTKDNCDG